MPQTDDWSAFPTVAPPVAAPVAPAYPGVIPGRVDPLKQAAEGRAQQDQALQEAAAARDAERLRLAQVAAEKTNQNLTESQGKAAGLLTRAIHANDLFETTGGGGSVTAAGAGPRSLIGEVVARNAPLIKNYTDDAERQKAVAAQRDFISAVLRVESGAAVSASEFDNYSKLYFPQPGDTAEVLKSKSQERRNALEALRVQAGPNGKDIAIPGMPGDVVAAQEGDNKLPAGTFTNGVLNVEVTDDRPPTPDPAVTTEANRLDKLGGPLGVMDLAKQGMTLGLADEASGIGTAIGKALHGDFNLGTNYRLGRDTQELRLNRARDRAGFAGTAAEFVGGAALPAGVLSRAGAGLSLGRATAEGSAIGALGGFGYGRGGEGSAINAAGGAVLGGALGYTGQRVGNALANRAALRGNPDLVTAGQAEGVTVNRAMVDPNSNNRVTKTDASLIGGRQVQREMGKIEGQVEGRVDNLGAGGQAMDSIGLGDTVKAAGERFIDKSGKAATVKYNRAEKLAGDAKVTPKESLARVDEMIGQLSETPSTNGNEIGFLNEIKSDLSQDLSVGGLRRMRTKLRQKISKGDLTFGEDEARVLSIMDGAANDIEAGLVAQGKGDAAKAFRSADTAYKARMDYISGTVQKLLGKRNATQSAEQIANKFNSMAKTDARGLRKFYATLDSQEQADVAATFAEQLGRNNKDGFTVTQFLRQTSPKNLSDEAARTLFGPQGAQSIQNLWTIGKEVERVTGAMNSRTSKSGVANYRDWIFSFLAGGGVGGVSGSATTAGAAAVAGVGAKAGMDLLSARALMSPKLTRWFLNAPKTGNAAAIDRHFNQLGEIAKVEPALAGDIEVLRKAIMGAANDNTAGRLAAEDQNTQEQPNKLN